MAMQELYVSDINERMAAVQQRIVAAAQAAGRNPADVRLIGVTKTHPADVVRAAWAAGGRDFGENRVQEAEAKIDALADVRGDVRWHLIGHLQRNKAKRAAALFDLVHSLDNLALAQALDRHAAEAERQLPVLLQVNVSGEASKDGFDLAGWQDDRAVLDRFCAQVAPILALPQLDVQGLMTVAPWSADAGVVQSVFRATRLLRDELAGRYPSTDWRQLSMGMTDDFELAIAEGATLVRVGRAISGERPK